MRITLFRIAFAYALCSCTHSPDLKELELRYIRDFITVNSGISMSASHEFLAWRDLHGPLTGAVIREKCSGSWQIRPVGNAWYLVLRPGTLVDMSDGICADSFEIWNPVAGYSFADDTVCIRHPMNGQLLCVPFDV